MDNKKNQASQAKILYVILAALVVTVMVVSVVTAVNKRNKKPSAPLDTTPVTSPVPKQTAPVTSKREWITAPPEDKTTEPSKDTEKPREDTRPVELPSNPDEDKEVINRSFVVPTQGDVMKDFSIDMPVYSVTMNDYRSHKGIDICAEYGSAVFSFTDGVIEKVYDDPMMGKTVIIDHGDGLCSKYCNLSEEVADGIEAGAKVKAGDVIGAVGDSSLVEMAESSHLHFELTENGKYSDPVKYLPVLKNTDEE